MMKLATLFVVNKSDGKRVWTCGTTIPRASNILYKNVTPEELALEIANGVPVEDRTVCIDITKLYVNYKSEIHDLLFRDEVDSQWLFDNDILTRMDFIEETEYNETFGAVPENVIMGTITLDGIKCDMQLFRKFGLADKEHYVEQRHIFVSDIPVDKTPIKIGDVLISIRTSTPWLYATRIAGGFKTITYDGTIMD